MTDDYVEIIVSFYNCKLLQSSFNEQFFKWQFFVILVLFSAFLKNGFLSLTTHLSSDLIEKLKAGKEVLCLFIGLKIFIKHYMLNFLILSFHS